MQSIIGIFQQLQWHSMHQIDIQIWDVVQYALQLLGIGNFHTSASDCDRDILLVRQKKMENKIKSCDGTMFLDRNKTCKATHKYISCFLYSSTAFFMCTKRFFILNHWLLLLLRDFDISLWLSVWRVLLFDNIDAWMPRKIHMWKKWLT